jgi:hypothetical protein
MRERIYLILIASFMAQGCSTPGRQQVPVALQPAKTINIREEKPDKPANAEAPEECLTTTREFITYIFRREPDIGKNKETQERWLSEGLRKAFKSAQDNYRECVKGVTETAVSPPGNEDFIGTWDRPTGYSIIGSRLYGERAVVDLFFTWGTGTDYPGDTRLVSYIFIREGASWKLDDIYTFRGEFTGGTNSLSQSFSGHGCQ